jgi:hypothetical protein
LAIAFWSISLGLAAMVLLSMLPVGLMQAWASVEFGTWYTFRRVPANSAPNSFTLDANVWGLFSLHLERSYLDGSYSGLSPATHSSNKSLGQN